MLETKKIKSATVSTSVQFSSVQSLSCVWLFVTQWTAAHQASLSITNSWSLLKLMSIESVMLSNHHPLPSPSPPTFKLPQNQGLFKWVSSLHQVAKILVFQLQHQSFQWTLGWSPLRWTSWISMQSKGLSSVQHHSLKASILRHSAFFIVQLSYHSWPLEKP